MRKVPKFGVKIERMLLNARKEIGFTINLKSVKKDPLKSEETRQENQQAPEWSWKKQQQDGQTGPTNNNNDNPTNSNTSQ